VNQCLETTAGDDVSHAGDAFTPGVAVEARDARVADSVNAPAAKNGRVLLMESDPCSRDTIRFYLAKSGYTVVAPENSRDALKAVMAGDFALVLYDPMTPGLDSEAFHKGLRRIDPELCERLVFLLGDRLDAGMTACIKKLDGFVLRKPFDALDLLDAMFSADVRGTFEGVFDRASSIPDPLPPGDGGEAPAGGADAVEQRVPEEVNAAGLKKGQVLLIEADPGFRETATRFLAGTGYTVMAFQNNRDALKAVMAGDFALVLYDPTTPELPADMFYQGVRRIDPELCERLVFLIGDRIDAGTGAFIKKIDGFVLRKPFDAKILADKIAASEVLGTLQGAFESASSDPGLEDCLSVDEALAAGTPRPQVTWFAETLCEAPADSATIPQAEHTWAGRFLAPQHLSDVIPEIDPESRPSWALRMVAFAGFALLGFLLLIRVGEYRAARASAAAATAQREANEAEWTTVSRDLRTAVTAQPRIEAEIRKLERIAGDRAVPRWSPGLRSLVPSWDAHIEILEVRGRGRMEDLGACEVSIRGVAGGSKPRQMAERFRQAVEAGFRRNANGSLVTAQIEQIEDVPGAPPEQNRAAFLIIATVGAIQPAVLMSKEGR
jgi:CheY-like chemotaxis protein